MSGKIIATVGVAGCGKSTWSKQEQLKNPETTVIVERDELRTQLLGAKYHKGTPNKKGEAQVTALQQELLRKHLREGKTVIASDTNLNPRTVHSLYNMAKLYGAQFLTQHFDVPPEECKRRNKARGKAGGREVPEHVLDGMIERSYDEEGHLKEMIVADSGAYFVPRSTPGMKLVEAFNKKAAFDNPLQDGAVLLCDIDGTLCNNAHFAAYYLNRKGSKKDFPGFYKSIEQAPVNEQVRDLANRMREEEGLGIMVLTGRDDSYAKELLSFIKKSGLKVSRVICKRKGDFRPDGEFKAETIQKLREEGLVPVHALDDRESSIRTMEAAGIMVSRVETPEFSFQHGDPVPKHAAKEPKVNTIYGSGFCIRCAQPLKEGNIGPKCRLK